MLKIQIKLEEFNQKHEWKYIEYPGVANKKYIVTKNGQVFKLIDKNSESLILAQCDNQYAFNNAGQLITWLRNEDNKQIQLPTSKLVAYAFCDGYDAEHDMIVYLDGDKKNINANNLKWATHNDVMQDYWNRKKAKGNE